MVAIGVCFGCGCTRRGHDCFYGMILQVALALRDTFYRRIKMMEREWSVDQ